ncbi:MAG TPA: hypothetical protein VIG33_15250 [Pseudobdellovibrionaceae bacterium]|jgi:hypothetical protein
MLRFIKLMALTGLLVTPLFSRAKDELFLRSAELKCVADGVEIATGPGGSLGLRPSEKYLALLGFAVQRNYKSVNSSTGGFNRELYLQRVIQILQADGFCVANKLDGGGAPTSQVGYGDVVRDKSNAVGRYLIYAVTGLKSKEDKNGDTQSVLTADQVNEVIKYFGFQNETYIQNLFRHDNWSSLEPDARQKLFSDNVESTSATAPEDRTSVSGMYSSNEYGEGLKDCFAQMKQMQSKSTIFNFKNLLKGRSSGGRKFCETVAKECQLESTTFCSISAPTFKTEGNGSTPGSTGEGSIFDKLKGTQ